MAQVLSSAGIYIQHVNPVLLDTFFALFKPRIGSGADDIFIIADFLKGLAFMRLLSSQQATHQMTLVRGCAPCPVIVCAALTSWSQPVACCKQTYPA